MQLAIILFGLYVFCGLIIASIECHWFEFKEERYDIDFFKVAVLWPIYFMRIFK